MLSGIIRRQPRTVSVCGVNRQASRRSSACLDGPSPAPSLTPPVLADSSLLPLHTCPADLALLLRRLYSSASRGAPFPTPSPSVPTPADTFFLLFCTAQCYTDTALSY